MPGVVSTPGAKGRSGGFRGAGGHSYIESYVEECPTEGGNCVERNGSERSQVASVAKRKPPASTGYRDRRANRPIRPGIQYPLRPNRGKGGLRDGETGTSGGIIFRLYLPVLLHRGQTPGEA